MEFEEFSVNTGQLFSNDIFSACLLDIPFTTVNTYKGTPQA